YYLFAIAVMLTTIYANYYVTCATALTGISATLISEFFIRWDPDKLSIFSSTKESMNFLIALFILTASSLVSIIAIRYEIDKNDASIQKELERQLLQERLLTDELTGVFSRKALHDAMRDIDANPSDTNCILAVVDIDKFKGINDCLGHHTGDSYLVAFASVLKENSAQASVYRYGGDEFCLLFHDANMDAAIATCIELQQQLSALTFDDYPELKLTASFGLATYSHSITSARLFVNADQAMYEAKKTADGICAFTASGK
ncbi:MAG TPA: GGDEF domain-containing protein, partial [Clostridia bacterium]|nr:GGDEF domain-containing protein [Clostridia bacterium]